MKSSLAKIIFRLTERNFPNPTQKIFYLHIPKCGGTSITDSITNLYHPRYRADILPQPSQSAANLLNITWPKHTESILAYYFNNPNIRCITGHFFWSEKCYQQFRDSYKFITILRYPVDRWLSNFFYDRYKTHSSFNKIEIEIDDFIETSKAQRMGSNLVRFLSGSQFVNQETINTAKKNLEKFDVLAFLEDMNQFQNDLEKSTGFYVKFPHKNKSPRNDLLQEYRNKKSIIRKIENLCQPDIEVYDYAWNQLKKKTFTK